MNFVPLLSQHSIEKQFKKHSSANSPIENSQSLENVLFFDETGNAVPVANKMPTANSFGNNRAIRGLT